MAALNSSYIFSNFTNKTACFEEYPFSSIGLLLFGIVFSLIALAGLIGNIMVMVVLLCGEESSKTRNIRIYLLNLAVCDIILTLFIPFNYSTVVLTYWIFPIWTCGVPHYCQKLITFNISATLTIIGFERFIVTVYPFSALCRWLKNHSFALIGSVWITGAIYGYIVFERQKTLQFTLNNATYIGCYPDHAPESVRNYGALNFAVSFFIPLVMLIISYVSIMRKLKKRDKISELPFIYSVANCLVAINNESSNHAQNEPRQISQIECELRRTTSAKTNTQKILFLVVLLYCVCWAPNKCTQLLIHFKILRQCLKEDFYRATYIFIGSYLLALTSCCINPILYSFMSQKFRKDLEKIKYSVCRRIRAF